MALAARKAQPTPSSGNTARPPEHKQWAHLYANVRWRNTSRRFLAANPLCAECAKAGRCAPSQCTDHVIPHRGDLTLFWDRGNYAALCFSCHSRKREDKIRKS